MNRTRDVWTEKLPPFPESEIEEIRALTEAEMFETCACFWLFRFLHSHLSPEAALTGDYCFGRFSAHLAELDSVELTDAFSAFLTADSLNCGGLEAYLEFIRSLSGQKEI